MSSVQRLAYCLLVDYICGSLSNISGIVTINPLWEFLWSNWMEDRGLQVQGVKASRWSDATQLSHTPADPKRPSSPLGPVTSRCEPWRMMSRHGRGATALPDPVPEGQKPRMWPPDAERNQRLAQPCDDLPPMPNKLQVVKEVQISFNLYTLFNWLVVWNILYCSIYWEFHHPIWLSFFSEG